MINWDAIDWDKILKVVSVVTPFITFGLGYVISFKINKRAKLDNNQKELFIEFYVPFISLYLDVEDMQGYAFTVLDTSEKDRIVKLLYKYEPYFPKSIQNAIYNFKMTSRHFDDDPDSIDSAWANLASEIISEYKSAAKKTGHVPISRVT